MDPITVTCAGLARPGQSEGTHTARGAGPRCHDKRTACACADHKKVSRHHATISRSSGGAYTIVCVGKNKVGLNGASVGAGAAPPLLPTARHG